MQIQFEQDFVQGAKIKVLGIGGAGSNAVDHLIEANLQGVEFYVMNTDVQALERSKSPNKIQIGKEITRGRGAGSDPSIGKEAAEAAREEIAKLLEGADIVFITAGLGGGTGTGAAPVVARIAQELGILTVAVVTLPFEFEGKRRAANAAEGLKDLRAHVDACTVVNNQRLLSVIDPKMPIADALRIADDVLTMGVTSVSEVINVPGIINVEFSDVRNIMQSKGGAVIGFGTGKGDQRAIEAVTKARENRLLDSVEIKGATGVLICFTGGPDLSLKEVSEASDIVYKEADPEANIILGVVIDEKMKDEVRVTIIATGLDKSASDLIAPGRFAGSSYQSSASPFASPSVASPGSAPFSAPRASGSDDKRVGEAPAKLAPPVQPTPEPMGRDTFSKISFVEDAKSAPAAEPKPASAASPLADPKEEPAFLRRHRNPL
jgi:cell division protein FtsZ